MATRVAAFVSVLNQNKQRASISIIQSKVESFNGNNQVLY